MIGTKTPKVLLNNHYYPTRTGITVSTIGAGKDSIEYNPKQKPIFI